MPGSIHVRAVAVDTVHLDPAHIVPVADFEPETLSNIVAHLEASTDFEHLVYREADLDAVGRSLDFPSIPKGMRYGGKRCGPCAMSPVGRMIWGNESPSMPPIVCGGWRPCSP